MGVLIPIGSGKGARALEELARLRPRVVVNMGSGQDNAVVAAPGLDLDDEDLFSMIERAFDDEGQPTL